MYITEENKTKLAEHLNKEISKILEQGLTKETLHCIYEILDIFKDMSEVDEKEMEMGGFSQRGGYSQRVMPYNNSYNGYDRSYSGNSYNSYGSDRDRMMDEYMSQASNDRERELVRRILNRM